MEEKNINILGFEIPWFVRLSLVYDVLIFVCESDEATIKHHEMSLYGLLRVRYVYICKLY